MSGSKRVGIAGAGQLARMTLEAASALGIETVILAEAPTDAAAEISSHVLAGSAGLGSDLERLAEACDVLTFDHEQVDLAAVRLLEQRGLVVRPGSAALEHAVDKSLMRTRLAAAGVPVPAFAIVGAHTRAGTAASLVESFAADHGWPLIMKAARGGYDGKGVWRVADAHEATDLCQWARGRGLALVIEELVPITAELAVLVARRADGEMVNWSPVETLQVDGVCRQVVTPACVHPDIARTAVVLARRVAEEIGVVGVMATELFAAGSNLLVNELATRPHNSGHWTIEGSTTSQFENHLRAILDLPLGGGSLTHACVASVNVFGGPDGGDPRDHMIGAMGVAGAHVHLYGKLPRPNRKLGHVTVCGTDRNDVRSRAWAAARSLGSPEPGTVSPVRALA